MACGDLTQKIIGVSVSGEMLNLVNTINDIIDQLAIFTAEVKKVAREVGTEGKLGVQAEVGNVQGIWQEITYVFFFLSLLFLNAIFFFFSQVVCKYHGWKPDDSSTRFCSNFSSSYGWRFYSLHHC